MAEVAHACCLFRCKWTDQPSDLARVIAPRRMVVPPAAAIVAARQKRSRGQTKPMNVQCRGLDTLGALAVLAVGARSADDEHGAALAAARLVGRHGGMDVGGGEEVLLMWD